MENNHLYNVGLQWQHDRKGIITSPELPTSIEVATPPDFPKGMKGIWSPEHLFVGAVSSCLMTTFLAIAENSKFSFVRFSCDAQGTVDKVEGKFRVTDVLLKPVVTVADEQQLDKALRLLEMSEKACLISLSVNSTVRLEPSVVVQ
jgi:peroxiredoxin-like protein